MVCVWHVRRSSSKGLSVVLQEMTHHEGFFFLWCRILFNKPLLSFPINSFICYQEALVWPQPETWHRTEQESV